MKVLAISGSPRRGSTIDQLVQEVLNGVGCDAKFVSLADQGRLSLALRWVERTGACLDQSYYFTRFDGVAAIGRAGFTYSAGDRCFLQEGRGGFRDNRIHISADIRAVLSAQYVHWRWTDLSGRGGRTSRPGAAVAMGHGAEREAQD